MCPAAHLDVSNTIVRPPQTITTTQRTGNHEILGIGNIFPKHRAITDSRWLPQSLSEVRSTYRTMQVNDQRRWTAAIQHRLGQVQLVRPGNALRVCGIPCGPASDEFGFSIIANRGCGKAKLSCQFINRWRSFHNPLNQRLVRIRLGGNQLRQPLGNGIPGGGTFDAFLGHTHRAGNSGDRNNQEQCNGNQRVFHGLNS